MSVLVAVLYAFSRLAAENEVTALKASGVSPWRLVTPALAWGAVMSLFLLAFNDQVLPRANFRLKTLQDDIAQTKPTFLLKPQVINSLQEERLYLKAGRIDQSNGHMREVVIYDLTSPDRRRTIYADSGVIGFAPNQRDLLLDLFSGQMQTVSTDKPAQLDRLFYKSDRIAVRNVGGRLNRREGDTLSRGDRELGICAMQKRLVRAKASFEDNRDEYMEALRLAKLHAEKKVAVGMPVHRKPRIKFDEPKNLAWAYCRGLSRLVGVKAAEAAEVRVLDLHPLQDTVRRRAPQDSAKLDSVRRAAADSARRADAAASAIRPLPPGKAVILGTPRPRRRAPLARHRCRSPRPRRQQHGNQGHAESAASTFKDPFLAKTKEDSRGPGDGGANDRDRDCRKHLAHGGREAPVRDLAAHEEPLRDRDQQEVRARRGVSDLRHPRRAARAALPARRRGARAGGQPGRLRAVLRRPDRRRIAREQGNRRPFWAMWGTNVILTIVGVILLLRMGREESSGRGGNWADRGTRCAR
jgi:hypothetical protein